MPLASVAQGEIVQAPQTINRVNQSRQISVTGDTISGDTTSMNKAVQAVLDQYDMPDGYHAEMISA